MSDSSQLHKVAQRANRMLNVLTEQYSCKRMSYTRNEFLPGLCESGTGKIASTDSSER